MTGQIHPGWAFLDRALVVVLGLQVALTASAMFQSGDNNAAGLAGLSAATVIVLVGNRRLAGDDANRSAAGWLVAWRLGAVILLGAVTLTIAAFRYLPADPPADLQRVFFSLLWVVIALKGAAVGKLKPNGLIGIRVPWTTRSRLAWDRAHRTLGRILFWGGLAGLTLSLVVEMEVSLTLWLLVIGIALVMALIEARSAFHHDPERLRA
jgi:uncharacterized membrane protein